jgi:hypothetical protein
VYIGVPFFLVLVVAYILYRVYFKKPLPAMKPPAYHCAYERRLELEFADAVEEYREMKEREHVAREYLHDNWPVDFGKYKARLDDWQGTQNVDVHWINRDLPFNREFRRKMEALRLDIARLDRLATKQLEPD